MIFTVLLYASLAVCIAGLLLKIYRWFSLKTSADDARFSTAERISAAAAGIIKTVLSPKIFTALRILIFDILLQTGIIRTSPYRWAAHMLIFSGFILLFFMHAIDEIFSEKFFNEYYSTLNPFLFLRNLFGLMVMAGIFMAVTRRIRARGALLATTARDRFAIIILALIMISGFALESLKIISEPVFDRMVEDYGGFSEDEEIDPLRHYWAEKFHVRFKSIRTPYSPEILDKGAEYHDGYCSPCHSSPEAAFVSLPAALLLKPAGVLLNKTRADLILYYLHVVFCFIGLALLPFSKFIHLLTDPLVLMVNGLMDGKKSSPANLATRRAMELDACVNCGACNSRCSVYPFYLALHNKYLLPWHKLYSVRLSSGAAHQPSLYSYELAEGAYLCTDCGRCTSRCPSGILLSGQWDSLRSSLSAAGFTRQTAYFCETGAPAFAELLKSKNIKSGFPRRIALDASIFSPCFECQTCNSVCPVLAVNTGPLNNTDITPQKIMNLLRMGLTDYAMASSMAWKCATCYQCSENCPQGIPVTDIIYELKNTASRNLRKIKTSNEGSK